MPQVYGRLEVDAVPILEAVPLMATIDPPMVDGFGLAGFVETFKEYIANPLVHEG